MPGPTRLLRSRSSRRACGNPSRKAARGGGAVSRVAIADAKQGWPADHVARWPIDRLIPFAKNARTHTPAQIAQLAASMREPVQESRARRRSGLKGRDRRRKAGMAG